MYAQRCSTVNEEKQKKEKQIALNLCGKFSLPNIDVKILDGLDFIGYQSNFSSRYGILFYVKAQALLILHDI